MPLSCGKSDRSNQWLKFLPDHAESFVMFHELGIHLGELFERIRMGHDERGFQGLLVGDAPAGDNDFMKAVCRA